ncbi:MAG: hypothetical protein INQ03_12550 [Candidatus Heimdallarchaeota archaeon]|nr:hypothetical protein [Candidatus Heimdallarchaeota archaeon]
MAGLIHLGIGLAFKKVTPQIHTGILVALSYGIDLIWGIFYFTGLESLGSGITPFSHGLFMALMWTALVSTLIYWKTKDRNLTVLLGLLFYSHWIIDFISHPMTAVFPGDLGLTFFFEDTPLLGLGVWSIQLGMIIGEYVCTALCLGIFIHTKMQLKKEV